MPNPPRKITSNGRTQTLNEWAAETGLSAKTIASRLDVLGWTPERAMSAPADRRFRKGGRPAVGVPRPTPKMRQDGKGVAFARWRAFGRDHYRAFGRWGSPEALAAYRRFGAEWAAGSYEAPAADARPAAVLIGDVVVRWIEHVGREYRKLGGVTSEYHASRAACWALNDLYGDTRAAEFSPAKLRAVREVWISAGKARKTCNQYAYRIVRCFRWAAGQSLIPAAVADSLEHVENLKPGRTAAPDRPRVQAVDDATVMATLAALPATAHGDTIRAMVRVQRLAGLRPQHVVEMRPADLDRRGDVWKYIPPAAGTKTLHLDKRPTFYLGPGAQAALAPLLNGPADRPVFGYAMKGGRWVRITVDSYSQAIRTACRKAGGVQWHPHQLRHALATAVAERFQCITTAAAAIGDNAATAAAVYVHVDPQERARIEVARAMG